MTFDEERDDFLLYLANIRNLSPLSIKCYAESLEYLVKYASDNGKSVETFDYDDAKNIMRMLFDKNLSQSSINRHLSAFKQFFVREVKKNIIGTNPFSLSRTNKKVHRIPTFLNREEMEAILRYREDATDFESILIHCIYSVLIFTGIRRAELLALETGKINFDRNEMTVYGKGAKERIVFFTDYCKKAMKKYLAVRPAGGRTFLVDFDGSALSIAKLNIILKNTENEKIVSKHLTPHVFRHSFASFLLENKVDIMLIKNLMGHESISATSIYTHTDIHSMIDVYDKVFG